ncbi:MAG TPA: ABC transporter ATP-binding protein [Gaiellaceae bacterium]|nr:ABC transporter ATP-binding protein [Gaiellaceae bacterium]
MPLLEVENLKTYFKSRRGDVRAVDGVTFAVERGLTLGIVGESGCGKSVTALSVMGLLTPNARIVDGAIRFDGRDLTRLSERELEDVRGRQIAMIFQDPMTSLNPTLTIGTQLTETMKRHLDMSTDAARKRAIELLEEVHIPNARQRLDDYPHRYSGGMRQRVMIAIALSCRPKLILADEPTTALDVTIQAQLLELMRGLSREFGVALVMITHNLGVVARYADRVNVMYAGKIVESGAAADIYRDPRHPYTIGLLHSVPRLDQPRRTRLEPIEGQPPDLWALPPGCSFRPRCRYAIEKCAREVPALRSAASGHDAACFVAEQTNNVE